MFTLNQLTVFKRVAETGSFNKASSEEYMTTNAVMKQINKLEHELGFPLLIRSHKGVRLTEAGVSFYEDTVRILSICDSASARAKSVANKTSVPIRFGSSAANRPEDIESILTKVFEKFPDICIEMVPFENTSDGTAVVYPNLGERIDVIASSFDDYIKKNWKFEALELSRVPISLVLSKAHALAGKALISFEDLAGEKLMIVRQGYSLSLDEVRNHIETYYPKIKIIDVPAFGMELYNKVVSDNLVLLGIGSSIHAHPLTTRILLDWHKKCPFGILYSKNPSEAVKRFISAVKSITADSE